MTELVNLGSVDLKSMEPAALGAWGIERIEAAVRALEPARELRRTKAEFKAIEAYIRANKEGYENAKAGQQVCVELGLRCERVVQLHLQELGKNPKGGRPRKNLVSDTRFSEGPPTLAEIGLDPTNANKSAVLAQVTPEQFEAGITALRGQGELSKAAMLNLMGEAMAAGMSPDQIESSVKAEGSRRPKEPPMKLKIDLSPIATAIADFELNDLWTFDPADCAATVDSTVRVRMLRKARFCRDWLDRFITAVEETERAEVQEKSGREAA